MKKLDEREELLRAGLFGVHEVVVFSLNKILLEELNEEDEDRKAKLEGRFFFFFFFFDPKKRFLVYCEAVVAFCELFVRNNQVIFDQIEEWGELDGFKSFLSERPSKESIENLLRQAEGMYQIAEERGKKEEGMFFFF